MNKVFNKIKIIRESLGLTQAEMAINAGVNRSDISKLENGEKKFIDISIVQYLNTRGVDMNELFSEEEKINIVSNQQATSLKQHKSYPLLPIEAFAGISSQTDYSVNFDSIKDRYIIPLFEGRQVDFLIYVRGDSMYPKYSSGDVVACKFISERLFIQWNKVYVVDTKSQGTMIKRLKKSKIKDHITFKSDNDKFEEFDVPNKDIRNVALVVGVIRLE